MRLTCKHARRNSDQGDGKPARTGATRKPGAPSACSSVSQGVIVQASYTGVGFVRIAGGLGRASSATDPNPGARPLSPAPGRGALSWSARYGQTGPASVVNVPLLEYQPLAPKEEPPKNHEKKASSCSW